MKTCVYTIQKYNGDCDQWMPIASIEDEREAVQCLGALQSDKTKSYVLKRAYLVEETLVDGLWR
jgi:hypothetical protein